MAYVSQDQFHQKSFGKILSKESSKSYPSLRVYYGDVSGAVPFTWETRPGTPKHAFSENPNIPPLTPPPSYYARSKSRNSHSRNPPRSKLLFRSLLGRMNSNKSRLGSSSPKSLSSSDLSSLSWSSSAKSSFSDSATAPQPVYGFPSKRRQRLVSWDLFFDENMDVDEKCTPARSSRFSFLGGKGKLTPVGYSVLLVKKALLSIVGRGSA